MLECQLEASPFSMATEPLIRSPRTIFLWACYLATLFTIHTHSHPFIQLFAGDYPEGPQAFCNDPSSRSLAECLRSPTVRLRITTSREFLPNSNYSPSILVPTVW